MKIEEGSVFIEERIFTNDEVINFGKISGDQGIHHIEPDENGRLMVQGLLTSCIGTKVGGDLNYIARQMISEFFRPVFTGDKITCTVTLTKVEQADGFKKIEMTADYTNQKDKQVLVGTSYGIIRD